MVFGLGVVFLFGRSAREIAAASVIVATASTNVLKGSMLACSPTAPSDSVHQLVQARVAPRLRAAVPKVALGRPRRRCPGMRHRARLIGGGE